MSLTEGKILEAWQLLKVVVILKLNKDHRAAKGWRPINLINCIRKLVEKEVVNEMQEAGGELFYEGQYGAVKGCSALEAMMRTLTRAQRALARSG